jgi:hypothetical protein
VPLRYYRAMGEDRVERRLAAIEPRLRQSGLAEA